MGGYGAARIGMKHHEKFAAVSMLGAGPLDLDFRGPRTEANPALRERLLRVVYGNDIEYFKKLNPHTIAAEKADVLRGRLKLRMLIGDGDFTLEANREFSLHLKKLGIEHSFIVFPGVGHNAPALIRAGGDSHWAFYRETFSGSAE
jgi:acetyl esterase/lipase